MLCVRGNISHTCIETPGHLAQTRHLYFQVLLPIYPQTDFNMTLAFLTFDPPFFFLLALLQ